MIDIDDFFVLLTEVCDELPDDFFRELHQGVVLSEETKISPYARDDDLVIMGEYRSSRYGNQITERALEKVSFGKYGNGLGMRIGVGGSELDRVQVRSDVALRGRCPLDFEDGARSPEEFDVAAAACFRNLDAEIQSQALDIFTAHAHNLGQNVFAHRLSLGLGR